jgi:hypothetical protein
MEYWSVGVLRILRIAPRERGVGGAFRAVTKPAYPGLKPWAALLGHFMAERQTPNAKRRTPNAERQRPISSGPTGPGVAKPAWDDRRAVEYGIQDVAFKPAFDQRLLARGQLFGCGSDLFAE